jgi:hypothetical protein
MPGPSTLNIPEQQVGAIAYLYGITNNGTPVTIGGLDSFEFDSDDVTVTWDEKANKDTTGNTQNYTQTNFRWERSMKIFPSGATRTAAATVAHEALAAGGAAIINLYVLVVANYKVNEFNGNWRIKPGAKVNLKMDDNASIDFSMEKFVNAAQNTALTGAPIVG